MLKVILTVLCLSALSNAAPKSLDQILLSRYAPVTPRALSGIQDCGVSRLVDVRFTGCTSAPCQVNKGSSYELAVDFSPRDMHWDMEHRSIILKDTQLVVLSEGPIPDSTVQVGQTYTMRFNFNVPQQFSGESELRIKVFQNYVHEICLVIPLNIN